MTFDDITPVDFSKPEAPHKQFLQSKSSLLNFLGLNREGGLTKWGEAMQWIPGLHEIQAIGDKGVAETDGKGKGDVYQNTLHTARNAGVAIGTELLAAADITKDVMTGNYMGVGKDVVGLGKSIKNSTKTGDNSPTGGGGTFTSLLGGFLPHTNTKANTETANKDPQEAKWDDVHPWIKKLAQLPDNSKNPTSDTSNVNPETGIGGSGYIPYTEPGVTDTNTDTEGVGSAMFSGAFRKGGTITGPAHEEGGVKLLDKNGRDMGLTVEGGEKIINEEDFSSITTYLKKGHHKKALALLQNIEKREPEMMEMGKGGTVPDKTIYVDDDGYKWKYDAATKKWYDQSTSTHSESGRSDKITKEYLSKQPDEKVPVSEKVGKLTDTQLAALASSPRIHGKEYDDVQAEIKNRGFETTYTGFLESGDTKRTKMGDVTLYKKGQPYEKTKVKPDTSFDYDKWSKGELNDAATGKQKDNKPVNWFATKDDLPTEKTPAVKQGSGKPGTGVAATGKKTKLPAVDPMTEAGLNPDGSIADLKDPAKPLELNTDGAAKQDGATETTNGTQNKTDIKSLLNNAAGTGFDAMRLGLGIMGATKKLKDFQVPQEWADYMDKARYFSNTGLTPEEKALANRTEQANYGQAVNNITNASGGNQGAILGNLSAINSGRGAYANALAVKDAELKQTNFEKFLPVLNEDIGFKKDEFDRHYNEDLATKQAGAHLASDAISNMKSRADYNTFYGPGSSYDKLTKDLESKGASEADILKAQADFWKNPSNFLSATKTSPYNYHAFMPQTQTPA